MKLWLKVLIILTCIWTAVCALIYGYSKYYLITDYHELEQHRMTDQINQTSKTLTSLMSSVKVLNMDWSQWNDAYDFMKDKNKEFIASNLTATTLVNAKLNFILFYNTQGKLYYSSYYDHELKKLTSLPASVASKLEKNQAFSVVTSSEGKTGIIKTENGYLVVSALPILDSNGDGPTRGTLLMGYFITYGNLAKLADIVNVNLRLLSVPIEENNPLLSKALTSINTGHKYYIATPNEHEIFGFSALHDFEGKTIGIIRIVAPRTLYQQGLETIHNYLLIIFAMGGLFLAVTWVLLRIFVLNRIMMASKQVKAIKESSDFSQRISIGGHDELTSMTDAFNSFMKMIELTQGQLKYRIFVRTEELQELTSMNKNLFDQVSSQKATEAQLRSLAYYDSLTGLPNRLFFEEILRKMISSSTHDDTSFAVIFIDADKFKSINDTYGHNAGDKFLQHVAEQLKKTLNEGDVAARFAGDEFVIYMSNIRSKELAQVAVEKLIQAIATPFQLDETEIVTTFSVGISLYPNDGKSVDELEKYADLAMYYAKREAESTFKFYHDIKEEDEELV